MKNSSDLVDIFNRLFAESEQTILIGGADEPLYSPLDPLSSEPCFHRIFFRADYFSSALHEVSHWCLAGKKRRQLEDYGYWYKPDGRDQLWQSRFEEVEIKPQALESIFSSAAGVPFHYSIDNLSNPQADNRLFQEKTAAQIVDYQMNGLPRRAKLFYDALCLFYIKAPVTY